ncbi:putative EXPRESSED-RELATED [Salix viminalis]|uniref:EXPRESSED-RELATED n=1 Tax=Salix viminalis TaxID=40686 RepID=A0A9Q0T831_SALVM|nr:putative EXPRESSED-RELATED [Salix viminalis]
MLRFRVFVHTEEERKGKTMTFIRFWGLNKECSATELRSAYKKLALRWHPDRCSASGNSKFVEEAQQKFQAIQQAYSVLSDTNRRFLYDVGVYDSDDDENGMGDFLNEMAVMMSQTKPSLVALCGKWDGNPVPSICLFERKTWRRALEELRELFDEMFQEDLNSFGMDSQAAPSCSPSHVSSSASSNSNNERVSVDMNLGKTEVDDSSSFNSYFEKFCLGVEQRQPFKKVKEAVRGGIQGGAGGRRRQDKNQKVSSGYNR